MYMDLPYLIGFLILLIWNLLLARKLEEIARKLEEIKNAHNSTVKQFNDYIEELSKVINNIIAHVNDIEDFLEGAEVEEESKED